MPGGASCWVCGRSTYDPDKRERPWARGVAGGRLVLICPRCQTEHPDWPEGLDACDACGSTRLSITLGEVICRVCGHTSPAMR
ncbi:MAG TPA: hypothetical protein VMP42_01145 [Actinomycetota bacterium]|nr:hypothetical protein [Actinomycetota bacterium]